MLALPGAASLGYKSKEEPARLKVSGPTRSLSLSPFQARPCTRTALDLTSGAWEMEGQRTRLNVLSAAIVCPVYVSAVFLVLVGIQVKGRACAPESKWTDSLTVSFSFSGQCMYQDRTAFTSGAWEMEGRLTVLSAAIVCPV